MAGCSHSMVWASYLLVDVAVNTVLALLAILLIPTIDVNNTFSQPTELGKCHTYKQLLNQYTVIFSICCVGVLFLLFFLYGLSGSAFAYMMSFSKNTVAGAYALLVVINILVGKITSGNSLSKHIHLPENHFTYLQTFPTPHPYFQLPLLPLAIPFPSVPTLPIS